MLRWLRVAALWLVLALSAGLAGAQEEGTDYESWSEVASRAEEAVASERASTEAFEELRSTLAGWRDTFLQAESTNASRIQTLQSQLDAL
ncbi:MAG: mechanosensitive ion channel protein MscS, partial [Pelagibaca sp.]|nr:mechanosensitive ion channel protein MscS [Pelagibaca sp.]